MSFTNSSKKKSLRSTSAATKSGTEAMPSIQQIVNFAIVEKGMRHKGDER